MTEQMTPGIAHYLPAARGAIRSVSFLTPDGETGYARGRIDGWAISQKNGGAQYLKVTAGRKTQLVPAADIERHLEATGQLRDGRRPAPVERCGECRKVLDTGPLGHMDEFSGVPGLCYNCV